MQLRMLGICIVLAFTFVDWLAEAKSDVTMETLLSNIWFPGSKL